MIAPLTGRPELPVAAARRLRLDFDRFGAGLPGDLPALVRERYAIDLTGEYAGRPIRLPFGKASGQLSMTAAEVSADARAGLGFVVLKTVIAQDAAGDRAMADWARRESAMRVERRRSAAGREGWTVTWKGRGWDRSFDDYLALVREARDIGVAAGMPVAASAKYHLPVGEEPFRVGEYAWTTRALAEAAGDDFLLEKDFSPTLAGDPRASDRAAILRWLRQVPGLVKRHARVTLGMKLMNARFEDDFQVSMLETAADGGADYVVCFNRLFDPDEGVAYGGWDLSDRNLRVLEAASRRCPVSATGNIVSGRMMVEYARRGATSGQLHTFFQLPLGTYPATAGSRTERALHALLFEPEDGLIAWMLHLGETGVLARRDGLLHFLDLARPPDA